ncbi:MAG: Cellobiose 2-epimerase [Methanosaeta sp. PtaU1.Bin060]|nr:MAG: Cellobiose 2-epimerase [Methanosaeta sp. PtaU1.Bin060]
MNMPDHKPNRLISEKSPYLLQHAHNPVDWYPWCEEAFSQARQLDRPVFLSVGYSTCHWCHVMAHESFEDQAVADLMNDAFVSIKVDREERPEIDQVYMAAAQMMTGRGGWPLTVIMTPDKKPFFAATYIPKTGRFGQMGMLELIPKIKDLWRNHQRELQSSADKITGYLLDAQAAEADAQGKEPDASILARGYEGLSSVFDPENGGFGSAPKFPTPHNILFLLHYWQRSEDRGALEMAEATLGAMRLGGLYDHVGYGFHRYSTDASWSTPHFEKMLYDQALLAMAYTEAHQATRKPEYSQTAREILEYVLRDMTSPEGGFFSAEDADSEGEEGRFYLWTSRELKELLDKEEFQLMIRLFDLHEEGNFEKGRNVLRLRSSIEDAAYVLKVTEKELRDRLEVIRLKLFHARQKRARPLRDDKILADWNGLMIAALSKAAQALDEPQYAAAARKAADFILTQMRPPGGGLFHIYKNGAGVQANLDDYAFMTWGLIELYETVFDPVYLREALKLSDFMLQHFWDGTSGGLFFSPDDGEALLVHRKEIYDGAVPSGNSVAMLNLLRLSHLTGDPLWSQRAMALLRSFANAADGPGHAMLLSALDYALGPVHDVAIVGDLHDGATDVLLRALRERFLPSKAVLLVNGDEVRSIALFTMEMAQVEGRATAYVCSGSNCHLPTTDPERMIELLEDRLQEDVQTRNDGPQKSCDYSAVERSKPQEKQKQQGGRNCDGDDNFHESDCSRDI